MDNQLNVNKYIKILILKCTSKRKSVPCNLDNYFRYHENAWYLLNENQIAAILAVKHIRNKMHDSNVESIKNITHA